MAVLYERRGPWKEAEPPIRRLAGLEPLDQGLLGGTKSLRGALDLLEVRLHPFYFIHILKEARPGPFPLTGQRIFAIWEFNISTILPFKRWNFNRIRYWEVIP